MRSARVPKWSLLLALAVLPIPAWSHPASPTPSWEPIGKAPVVGRTSAGVVWTGERMIVWGGIARGRSVRSMSDGAAYDPDRDVWRTIASAPGGVLGGGGEAAAWTGRRAVFWAGNSPDGPARGAVYMPGRDIWRRLPRGPLGPREGYVSVWTGTELVIVGGTLGDGLAGPIAAAVSPRERAWRRLHALNHVADGLRPSGAVWTGDLMFVGGLAYDCNQGGTCTTRSVLLRYDVETDVLTEIDLTEAPAPSVRPIAWTGTEVLAAGDDPADVVLFDPSDGSWRTASAAPCDGTGGQTAWLGGRYVTTCGLDALQVYDVASDAWETVGAGRSPFSVRSGSAIAWTGMKLIVWSGIAPRVGNPTPSSGEAVSLPAEN